MLRSDAVTGMISIGQHGSELEDPKPGAVPSNPLATVKHGARRVALDQKGNR